MIKDVFCVADPCFFLASIAFLPSSPPRAAACFGACGCVGAWVRDVGVNGAGVERHVGAWVRDVGVFYGADDGRLTGSAEEKSNNRVGNRE